MPYKAFNKDFTCGSKQYKENTTYEENGSTICEPGVMHYCDNPFDVLDHYPLVNEDGEFSEFAEVEPLGNVYREENKCATNKLRIGAKLGLKGFIKACIDFTLEKTKVETTGANTKRDNRDSSQLAASGDFSKLAASGDYSQLAASGYYSQLAASGYYSKLAAEGKYSVVMAAGHNSIAKAKIGSWITLVEWTKTDEINGKGNRIWIPKCVKTEYVDGERIKEDTFYKLVDGKFMEVEE